MSRLDVVVVGESLGLVTATRPGLLSHVRDMRLGFGGAESNVAIGVARLGGASGWIGRVGADAVGDLILRELRAESVEVHAARDEGAATALMLKERPQPGTSRISYYRRDQAGSRLTPDDVSAEVVARARVLHVTGISAGLGGGPLAAVHAAIDHASAAGALVSFDVNHRSRLWDDAAAAADAYRGLARRADIVFAGDDEAELLTGATEPEAQAEAILALGASHAVVKLGHRGALAASADGLRLRRDALRVPVVDTVGAGDAFVAGWLTELARGATAEQRLDTAIACGALACTAEGDWEAAPTRAAIGRLRAGDADPVSR
ncbi:sugar kinase [Microbacterium marinilacus]|uniref:Sugar kinase n=1 Tax=Microbacterium marinilacus TaxID=415209 RepID=A0ABP7BXL4_9MICO|nr:sugar kinase [Microbacterium marinilacus]MBY0688085.1 sugar kinase [Microbacterium marinilacus]